MTNNQQGAPLTPAPQEAPPAPRKFGTFEGVFTPTLLTILGVIMYLREGWVVGNAGFVGAVAIIVGAFAITGATGLSLSSLTTNIRIGAGGAYSIISQSLGLEVGGAIGIPLYASQALAVAMYVFGFRAGVLYLLPEAPPLLVDLATFLFVFVVAYIGPSLVFRVQFLILAVIAASLVSIAVAAFTGSLTEPLTPFGGYPGAPETGFKGTTFWAVFAVFFPAATGIMAGANLSGDLRDPRRSIPRGTMAAIGVSLAVYLVLAYWLARSATPRELVSNYYVMIDRSAFGPVVLAGLLGATLSSALGSIIGAPRILQAIAANEVVPASRFFARQDRRGEPRNATIVTGAVVLSALLLRDLNAIAPLITMFFLITYTMINVVVLVEQSLGLVSFRPLLRIPRFVPLLGATGCLFAMFIINPVFGLIAAALVVAVYVLLVRRHLAAPTGDVRSGLFVALAEWAARRVIELGGTGERAWKPNVLLPVQDADELRRTSDLVHALVAPKGTVKVVGVGRDELARDLEAGADELRRRGVFATATAIDAESFDRGVVTSIQALAGLFLTPNVVFVTVPDDVSRDAELTSIMEIAHRHGVGIIVWSRHPDRGVAGGGDVALCIGDQGPAWEMEMDLPNLDLATLSAYQIARNWGATLTLVAIAADPARHEGAGRYLERLAAAARLPRDTATVVAADTAEATRRAGADLVIFGLPEKPDLTVVRETVRRLDVMCLFVHDSGTERALA
ncbi:MAG: amino acid permease [Actinomycetota bacterium]|nr:amino acid permease [Actinomycetota bacterium]